VRRRECRAIGTEQQPLQQRRRLGTDLRGALARARRIFERLRDEPGFTGGITIISDYVREKTRRSSEVFVPLSHPPGQAQGDFGEAIGGVRRKLHCFTLTLPHSDGTTCLGTRA
jgi:transposase